MNGSTMDMLTASAKVVREGLHLGDRPYPKIGIILGSGLGYFAESLKHIGSYASIPFSAIPHFGLSTVDGHRGELIYASVEKTTPVIVMSGRLHFYEGYSASEVVFPLRTLFLLGISTVILTNASGAIADNFEPGQLMVITDHLNLTGTSPLIGKNVTALGERFVDMTACYDKELIVLAKKAAAKADITAHEGIYAGLTGPNYETAAEIRMLKALGAHAVGMSTVFETIAARHMGLRVLAISCLTNKAAGLSPNKISHEEVMEINAKVSKKMAFVLFEVIKDIAC